MTELWQAERESNSLRIMEKAGSSLPSVFSKLIAEWDAVTDKNQYTEGLLLLERALVAARTAGNERDEASALLQLAWTHGQLGNHEKALNAARDASVLAAKSEKEPGDQLHGQDYLVYAYLQLGEDSKAHGVVDEIATVRFNSSEYIMICQESLVNPLKARRDPSGEIRGDSAIDPSLVTCFWLAPS